MGHLNMHQDKASIRQKGENYKEALNVKANKIYTGVGKLEN